jgi:hypothetical protein
MDLGGVGENEFGARGDPLPDDDGRRQSGAKEIERFLDDQGGFKWYFFGFGLAAEGKDLFG